MRKRKYLYRLAMSVFFIILLPMLIFIICFGKYSYDKVEAANEEYQEALMEHYMVQLERVVIELKEHASQVSADSKEYDSIFWNKDAADNYWYYQAISELQQKYHNYPSSEFRIYYYDDKRILSEHGAVTLEQYLEAFESANLEQEVYLKNFFDEEGYNEYSLCIGGTEYLAEGKNRLLIGFCTNLGKSREKAMLLYEYTESDIKEVFSSAHVEKGFEGFLWSKDGFTFFFTNYSNQNYRTEVKKMMESEHDWKKSEFVVKESAVHPIVLAGYMNEYSMGNMTLTFLDNIMMLMAIVAVIMLLGYTITLYVAYKPVLYLTSRLDYTEGNELEVIEKELDARSEKIEEQEMLLLDLLLNNLLYKVPISKSKLKLLGIELTECYTVFLLEGYVLHDAECRRVIAEAEKNHHVRMFVIDLEGENQSVFVLFLEHEQSEEVKEWLLSHCSEWGVSTEKLVGGKMVQDIKEIWRCLDFCEKELNKDTLTEEPKSDEQRNTSSHEIKRTKLREDILAYMDEHYRDIDLSQASVADYFNTSTYTLSRIFRNDMGMGFVSYVNAKRVEYAKELLLTTRETVHDIAVKSGFSNDNNFFKVFKAHTGMSPTTFRDA